MRFLELAGVLAMPWICGIMAMDAWRFSFLFFLASQLCQFFAFWAPYFQFGRSRFIEDGCGYERKEQVKWGDDYDAVPCR